MSQNEVKRRQVQAFSIIIAFITLRVIAKRIGYNGITYIAICMELYGLTMSLISGGVSDSLGRVLKIRNAKSQYRNANRLRNNALILQILLGAVGAFVLMIVGQILLKNVFQMKYSTFILGLFAPVVILRSISAVLSGYSKGYGNELPVAIGDVLRQILLLTFSLFFSNILENYGQKVSDLLYQPNFTSMYGGIGVVIAFSLSEIFVIIFFLIIYLGNKKMNKVNLQDSKRVTESFGDSVRVLILNRGSMSFILFLLLLQFPVALSFYLKSTIDQETAVLNYGAYITEYLSILGIFIFVIWLFVLPITGKTYALMRKDEHRYAKSVFQIGVHISLVQSVFLIVFVTIMADKIIDIFKMKDPELAGKMLQNGTTIIAFAVLSIYFSRILILNGKKMLIIIALFIQNIIQMITCAIMLNKASLGIMAIVYAGLIGNGILFVILGFFSYKQMKQKIDVLQCLILPVAVSCVMGLLSLFLGKLLFPHMGSLVTILITFIITYSIYWLCLLVLRNFREQELDYIPGGKLLEGMAQLLQVF